MMIRSEHVYRQKWRDSREYCSSELSGLSREIGKLIEKLTVEKTKFSDKDRILNHLVKVKDKIDKANLTSKEWDPLSGDDQFNPVTFNRKNEEKFKFYVRLKRKFCCNIKKIKKDLKSLEKRREGECKYKYLQLSTEAYWEKIDCLIKNTEPKRISIARVLRDQWDSEQIIKLNQSGIPKYWRPNEQWVIDGETLGWWLARNATIITPFLTIIIAFLYPNWISDNPVTYWEKFLANSDGVFGILGAGSSLFALLGLLFEVLLRVRHKAKEKNSIGYFQTKKKKGEQIPQNGISQEELLMVIRWIKDDCQECAINPSCQYKTNGGCLLEQYLGTLGEGVGQALNWNRRQCILKILQKLNMMYKSGAKQENCEKLASAIDSNLAPR